MKKEPLLKFVRSPYKPIKTSFLKKKKKKKKKELKISSLNGSTNLLTSQIVNFTTAKPPFKSG